MAIDWTEIYEEYRGFWVALAEDERTVLGSGGTAREALEAALEKGYEDPILTRMPETLDPYIGCSSEIQI